MCRATCTALSGCIEIFTDVFSVKRSGIRADHAEQRALFPRDRLSVQGDHGHLEAGGVRENATRRELRAPEGTGLHRGQGTGCDILGDPGQGPAFHRTERVRQDTIRMPEVRVQIDGVL